MSSFTNLTQGGNTHDLPHPEVSMEIRLRYVEKYPDWMHTGFPPLKAEQRASLAPKLSTAETCVFRDVFEDFLPNERYKIEVREEIDRIGRVRREQQSRQEYWGPTVVGERGELRLKVMARSTVRQRWQALGVWNPEWGIPGMTEPIDSWKWAWPSSDPDPLYKLADWVSNVARPSHDQERWHERTARLYLEENGQWTNPNSQWKLIAGTHVPENLADVPPRPANPENKEAFLSNQAWYRFALEFTEECVKTTRVCHNHQEACDRALIEVKQKWVERHLWKDTWDRHPAWDPPQGVNLPDLEDPSSMEYDMAEKFCLALIEDLRGPPWEVNLDDPALYIPASLTIPPSMQSLIEHTNPLHIHHAPPLDIRYTDPPILPKKVRFEYRLTFCRPDDTTHEQEEAQWVHMGAFVSPGQSNWRAPRAPSPPPSPRLKAMLYIDDLKEEIEELKDEVAVPEGIAPIPTDDDDAAHFEQGENIEQEGGPGYAPTPGADLSDLDDYLENGDFEAEEPNAPAEDSDAGPVHTPTPGQGDEGSDSDGEGGHGGGEEPGEEDPTDDDDEEEDEEEEETSDTSEEVEDEEVMEIPQPQVGPDPDLEWQGADFGVTEANIIVQDFGAGSPQGLIDSQTAVSEDILDKELTPDTDSDFVYRTTEYEDDAQMIVKSIEPPDTPRPDHYPTDIWMSVEPEPVPDRATTEDYFADVEMTDASSSEERASSSPAEQVPDDAPTVTGEASSVMSPLSTLPTISTPSGRQTTSPLSTLPTISTPSGLRSISPRSTLPTISTPSGLQSTSTLSTLPTMLTPSGLRSTSPLSTLLTMSTPSGLQSTSPLSSLPTISVSTPSEFKDTTTVTEEDESEEWWMTPSEDTDMEELGSEWLPGSQASDSEEL